MKIDLQCNGFRGRPGVRVIPHPDPLPKGEGREKRVWGDREPQACTLGNPPSPRLRRAGRGPGRRGDRAFTLIEVVLAILIAVGLLIVALSFYHQAADLRVQLLQEADRIAAARLMMDRITQELRAIPGGEAFGASFSGGSNHLEFVKTDLPSQTAWTGPLLGRATSPSTDLKLVRYELLMNDTNVTGLFRSERALVIQREVATSTNTVEISGLAETPSASRTNTPPLTDLIRHMQFRYWNGSAWVDAWEDFSLPKAVEVSLGGQQVQFGLEESGYPVESFKRVIYLPASGTSL